MRTPNLFRTQFFLLILTILGTSLLPAQTNVRAWYADGQVWVVWEITSFPPPVSYTVYAKTTPFNNTANATLVGRPLYWEYLGGALKEQVDTSLTLRVPNGQGGVYQLEPNEGLFVFTPHQGGSLYFAVTKPGETAVTAGDNITDAAVPFAYSPANDPVECHIQAVFPSPFASNYTCIAYYLWADGRQEQWDNRPDFPVMANAAKNGMPSLFMVGIPPGLDTTQPFPLSVWLHGGGGQARQSLPGSRPIVNLKAEKGILLAHNDDLLGFQDSVPPVPDQPSWHFGWRKNYDPFTPGNAPTQPDTIVNYTQRRYRWIDAWLTRRYNVDTTRININGHSMGGAGTTAMAKTFPNHYATATVFNNSFGGPEPGMSVAIFGSADQNFPTNLVNRNGETVHLVQIFNLTDRNAVQRDWPVFRSFHSKNDDNGVMHWGSTVVGNYRTADSLGTGAQLMWSERGHGIDTGPQFNDHWHNGNEPNQQTVVDDIAYEESHFRSDVSYPAFFNHRLDPNANDPGDGTVGTGPNGTGDDWGAWGGWHRWDWDGIAESADSWSVTAWLENSSPFANDNCPFTTLKADLAIRKPQTFLPATGSTVYWNVIEDTTGVLLQSGIALVQDDDLVVVPQIEVFREDVRRVRIQVFKTGSSVQAVSPFDGNLRLVPNPSAGQAAVEFVSPQYGEVVIKVTGYTQSVRARKHTVSAGPNRIEMPDLAALPAGVYVVEVLGETFRTAARWVKI